MGDVTVRAWSTADTLGLRMEDRGRGFDPKVTSVSSKSAGLSGMRERVLLLDGRLAIESGPSTGTQITAELPIGGGREARAMPISIVLADDHPVVRRGIQAVLEKETEFSVVGEAGDGLETVRLVERLQPDVLVLDLMMPGLSGLEVLRVVRQRSPRTRVVVLSMYSEAAFVVTALKDGATSYVLKGGAEKHLVHAVREAAAGKRYLSPPVTEERHRRLYRAGEVGRPGPS